MSNARSHRRPAVGLRRPIRRTAATRFQPVRSGMTTCRKDGEKRQAVPRSAPREDSVLCNRIPDKGWRACSERPGGPRPVMPPRSPSPGDDRRVFAFNPCLISLRSKSTLDRSQMSRVSSMMPCDAATDEDGSERACHRALSLIVRAISVHTAAKLRKRSHDDAECIDCASALSFVLETARTKPASPGPGSAKTKPRCCGMYRSREWNTICGGLAHPLVLRV